MKKIILIISLILLATPVFAEKADLESELYQNAYKRALKNEIKKESLPITDELLNPNLYKDAAFRLGVYKSDVNETPISDELIDGDFITKAEGIEIIKQDVPDDLFFEKTINPNSVRKIKSKTKYDFTKKQIPISIRIAEQLKSTKELIEGSVIPFIAEHDFVIKGKQYKKGTTILGRVETVSSSDKMGVPQSIKIDNFYIDGSEEINLHGSISKTGANRSIWVYPLYQAGNICFYVAGFVFVPIHGGNAKLLTSETFTVFYETQ